MTRGKYAAKANGQRAEAASNTAEALRAQIDQMRRDHAAEIATLKAQVDRLNGRLVNEVRSLAAAEVRHVQDEARNAVEEERARRRDAHVEISDLLRSSNAMLPEHVYVRLAELLDGRIGDGLSDGNRRARRAMTGDGRRLERIMEKEGREEVLRRGVVLALSADNRWIPAREEQGDSGA